MPSGRGLPRLERVEAVDDIATPATATAEDVAEKVNELLAALRSAGLQSE